LAGAFEALNASKNVEDEAWCALNAAYDTHYRRVYCTRPIGKLVSHECAQALSACLVDYAELFVARLRERSVDVETLEAKPVEMLANEALCAWFNKIGTNGYLRRVSHRMHDLRADWPYHLDKTMAALIERYAPKPEPRRAVAPVVALVSATMSRNERKIVPLPMPVFHSMNTLLARPSTRPTCDGWSARTALGTIVPFAMDLVTPAHERGEPPERVVAEIDEPNEHVPRVNSTSNVATTNEIPGVALDKGRGGGS
jgi:hypothetical protein